MRNKETRPGGPRSYDLLGSIAVVNADAGTAKAMAKAIMLSHPRVKTVLRRGGAVSGRFRTRRHVYVAGKRNYVADYRENGCEFRFDVRKSFFSPRLAFERQRVSAMSKPGETIIVMFAGVGPFAIEAAKAQGSSRVIAIELNRNAVSEMKRNIEINKARNVEAVLGDVHKEAGRYKGAADRIVMPLPASAFRFLPDAFKMAKASCTLHYYSFVESGRGAEAELSRIRRLALKSGRRVKLLGMRTARTYSASEIEVVLDIKVSRIPAR